MLFLNSITGQFTDQLRMI